MTHGGSVPYLAMDGFGSRDNESKEKKKEKGKAHLNFHFQISDFGSTTTTESGTLAEWLTRCPAIVKNKAFRHFLRERVFESHRCRFPFYIFYIFYDFWILLE
jgi:hypothetical protein